MLKVYDDGWEVFFAGHPKIAFLAQVGGILYFLFVLALLLGW